MFAGVCKALAIKLTLWGQVAWALLVQKYNYHNYLKTLLEWGHNTVLLIIGSLLVIIITQNGEWIAKWLEQ